MPASKHRCRSAVMVPAVIAMIGFPLLLQRAAIGVEMRGVAENALLAAQRGINIHTINALSWAAATVMASAGSMIATLPAPLKPVSMSDSDTDRICSTPMLFFCSSGNTRWRSG